MLDTASYEPANAGKSRILRPEAHSARHAKPRHCALVRAPGLGPAGPPVCPARGRGSVAVGKPGGGRNRGYAGGLAARGRFPLPKAIQSFGFRIGCKTGPSLIVKGDEGCAVLAGARRCGLDPSFPFNFG